MLPNEILPAIPRQKVKKKNGMVCDVLGHSEYMGELIVFDGEDISTISPKDCEPVPEEPRPLRIGDKVVTCSGTLSTIVAIMRETDERHSYRVEHSGYDFYENQLRQATPFEVAQYFN